MQIPIIDPALGLLNSLTNQVFRHNPAKYDTTDLNTSMWNRNC